MDEPSLGLAPRIIGQIYGFLEQLPARGVTVLLVEQNVHAALRIADFGYVLSTGEVVESGSSQELLEAVDLESAYLGTEGKPERPQADRRESATHGSEVETP